MKTVVLTSGGIDSTVLLHHLASFYPIAIAPRVESLRAIAFNYGQRHAKELSFAYVQATRVGVPLMRADLTSLCDLLPGSSQTDATVAVPEGRYDEESMKATVVPNRNMIMLAIAIGHAIAFKFEAVAYAAHSGDHAIYPDCRPEFADAMNHAAELCDWHKIKLIRPFIEHSKADIICEGHKLDVDFSQTWSCYAGKDLHCGRCGTCYERILAFKEAGVPDPTKYLDPDFALREERKRTGDKTKG